MRLERDLEVGFERLTNFPDRRVDISLDGFRARPPSAMRRCTKEVAAVMLCLCEECDGCDADACTDDSSALRNLRYMGDRY